jgi:RNA polymerase sigma-70 factor (TIGR02943 family)
MTSSKDQTIKEWVESFSEGLYLWAFKKTSKKEVAEDLVQETFLAALKAFDKFEGRSSAKTWLHSILNHKIIDYYRKNSKLQAKTDSLDEPKAMEVSDAFFKKGHWNDFQQGNVWNEEEQELLDNPEFNKVLAACMGNLPERWHSALTSKYLLQKDAQAICKELDITASNYWQIIRRAKLLVRACLNQNWTN